MDNRKRHLMAYSICGKTARSRYGIPSGIITNNPEVAIRLCHDIPEIGFIYGKGTGKHRHSGNREDILCQPTPVSLMNAVGLPSNGLEEKLQDFAMMRKNIPKDVLLIFQIAESCKENFAYCAAKVEEAGNIVDFIEANLSCPHALDRGILIGSKPNLTFDAIEGITEKTSKPVFAKVPAGIPNLFEVVDAAVEAGAAGLTLINTLFSHYPELSIGKGGLSGPQLYKVLYDTASKLRAKYKIPMMLMGGICGASDIRRLDQINEQFPSQDGSDFFYAIGTALAGMNHQQKVRYFRQLGNDMRQGTDFAKSMSLNKMLMEYNHFIVKEVVDLSETLRIIKFYENLDAGAGTGQFVMVKTDEISAKPFSVANDSDGLEILVRKRKIGEKDGEPQYGETTSMMFDLHKNSVVRIRGPYGADFSLPDNETVVYAGGGCGIGPIVNAASHHKGKKYFFIGATTEAELAYVDELRKMGELFLSTDDGTAGYHGNIAESLARQGYKIGVTNPIFFNCGPVAALIKLSEVEQKMATPDRIFHDVEMYTKCCIGVCGSCSTDQGELACVS